MPLKVPSSTDRLSRSALGQCWARLQAKLDHRYSQVSRGLGVVEATVIFFIGITDAPQCQSGEEGKLSDQKWAQGQ